MLVGIANKRFPLKSLAGKTFRYSRCMRNPQFYVIGKRPIGHNLPSIREFSWDISLRICQILMSLHNGSGFIRKEKRDWHQFKATLECTQIKGMCRHYMKDDYRDTCHHVASLFYSDLRLLQMWVLILRNFSNALCNPSHNSVSFVHIIFAHDDQYCLTVTCKTSRIRCLETSSIIYWQTQIHTPLLLRCHGSDNYSD